MQKSGRERRHDDPKANERKKSAAPQEPRQAESTSDRQGRAPRNKGDLTVQRRDLHPAKHRDSEENIVRVKTGADRPMLVLILLLYTVFH